MIRTKHLIFLSVCVGLLFIGWRSYQFFFDKNVPHMQFVGIEDNGFYGGDVACTVVSDKTGEFSLWLDGNPLISRFKLQASVRGHEFIVPTQTIPDGKHTLKAILVDSSFNKNHTSVERDFTVDNIAFKAALVKSDQQDKVLQGRTLHVQFQANKPVKRAVVQALAREFECYPEAPNSLIYEAFIPVSCEEKPNEYLFCVNASDAVGNSVTLESKFLVVAYPFKTQNLHVDDEKIKKEAELGADRKKFDELMQELAQNSPKEKLWRGVFCTPIDIRSVTTDFGTIRTTQHKGRYAHKALDVTNLPRSVVWSTQDGIVVLKDRFADSGKTVVVDHGLGVLSMFFHLEDFANINVGEKIGKGSPLGTLGKTGYAKGYHLHWEMRINNVPVDPMQWTKTTF